MNKALLNCVNRNNERVETMAREVKFVQTDDVSCYGRSINGKLLTENYRRFVVVVLTL